MNAQQVINQAFFSLHKSSYADSRKPHNVKLSRYLCSLINPAWHVQNNYNNLGVYKYTVEYNCVVMAKFKSRQEAHYYLAQMIADLDLMAQSR